MAYKHTIVPPPDTDFEGQELELGTILHLGLSLTHLREEVALLERRSPGFLIKYLASDFSSVWGCVYCVQLDLVIGQGGLHTYDATRQRNSQGLDL